MVMMGKQQRLAVKVVGQVVMEEPLPIAIVQHIVVGLEQDGQVLGTMVIIRPQNH
jgi:hypothetical protein